MDDVEVNSSNVFSWQKKIGLIPQETFLANTSIINNICLGIPENNIDFDKLNSVIEDVRLNDLINEKNNGIREIVGENGKNLSGGQKQKISLARALYFDREILIFDEPSSALDALNQSEVHKTIDSMIGKKTIILISHKIELLNNFHKIYLIHDKKVSLK